MSSEVSLASESMALRFRGGWSSPINVRGSAESEDHESQNETTTAPKKSEVDDTMGIAVVVGIQAEAVGDDGAVVRRRGRAAVSRAPRPA